MVHHNATTTGNTSTVQMVSGSIPFNVFSTAFLINCLQTKKLPRERRCGLTHEHTNQSSHLPDQSYFLVVLREADIEQETAGYKGHTCNTRARLECIDRVPGRKGQDELTL